MTTQSQSKVALKGGALLAASAGTLVFLVAAVWRDHSQGGSGTMTITVVGLTLVAVVLGAIGVGLLRNARRLAAGEALPAISYRHTYPLFGTLVGALGLALVARTFAIPSSFGQFGYYRGAAVAVAQAYAPRHMGKKACVECHEEQGAVHDKDAHARVQCEDCHGPGDKHIAEDGKGPIQVPKGKRACLMCHQRMAARPAGFAQIEWQEHYRFVGVRDTSIDCTKCHSPHEPLFMDRDLRTARLHPMIQHCGSCHIGRVDEKQERPETHPAIFTCAYCHEGVVKDFATRKHTKVQCETCHVFFPQSEFAGRIIRDADPRFCLLCHKKTDFRAEKEAPPSIEWPGHLEKVNAAPEDKDKRCIDCHREQIHVKGARP